MLRDAVATDFSSISCYSPLTSRSLLWLYFLCLKCFSLPPHLPTTAPVLRLSSGITHSKALFSAWQHT